MDDLKTHLYRKWGDGLLECQFGAEDGYMMVHDYRDF